MTATILSLVCIVLAALCLCLWVYACGANEDLIEAQWEADYYKDQRNKIIKAYSAALRDSKELRQEVIELQQGQHGKYAEERMGLSR